MAVRAIGWLCCPLTVIDIASGDGPFQSVFVSVPRCPFSHHGQYSQFFIIYTQIADPHWANVGILRWANVGNVRWANVILLVGPPLAQHLGPTLANYNPTLGQRWQIIIQRWPNVGSMLGQRWINVGPTLGYGCATIGPTLGYGCAQCWLNVGPTSVYGYATIGPMFGQRWVMIHHCWPNIGLSLCHSWPVY